MLLDQLKAIRALPVDQRSFAAFEKRPDMLAAGVDKAALDAFDFDDERALDEMIGRLGGGAPRAGAVVSPIVRATTPERLYRLPATANPKGLRFAEDMVAEAESGLDGLAADFIKNNLDHYTLRDDRPSPPPPEIVDALHSYAGTARGRQVLAYARDHKLRQEMIDDKTSKQPEEVDRESGRMFYNPALIRTLPNAPGVAGEGRETADFGTMIAHMFGHTPIGRGALGLPSLNGAAPAMESAAPSTNEIVVQYGSEPTLNQRIEEIRATREFENAYRRSKGLPPRRTYYTQDDVY